MQNNVEHEIGILKQNINISQGTYTYDHLILVVARTRVLLHYVLSEAKVACT